MSFFCSEELLLLKEESDKKVRSLEGQCGDLQSVIQQLSEDFQKVRFENTSAHSELIYTKTVAVIYRTHQYTV